MDNARGWPAVYRPAITLGQVRPRLYWPVVFAAAALVALLTYGVASVGPDCSKTLRENGVRVDVEPESPKMGPLVVALAEKAPGLLAKLGRSAA